jgi:hypothetical protein
MTYIVAYEKHDHGVSRVYVEADSKKHAGIMAKNLSQYEYVKKVYVADARKVK